MTEAMGMRAHRVQRAERRAARLLHVAAPAGAEPIAVTLRRNPRARRLMLSIDPSDSCPALVIPPFVSVGEAQAFLDSRRDWLIRRLAALPARIAFTHGAMIPFRGATLSLCHRPDRRGAPWQEGDVLVVTGDARHLARRTTDWLKRRAMEDFAARAAAKAALLDHRAPRVAVRDPKRQWGSCSNDGTLRLSWRLILAPEQVIDYVVAHEVAHLSEMNHGRAFWAIVARLTPHMATARIWLRRHGAGLLRYG